MNLYEELKPIADVKRNKFINNKVIKYMKRIKFDLKLNVMFGGDLSCSIQILKDEDIRCKLREELEKEGFKMVHVKHIGFTDYILVQIVPIRL